MYWRSSSGGVFHALGFAIFSLWFSLFLSSQAFACLPNRRSRGPFLPPYLVCYIRAPFLYFCLSTKLVLRGVPPAPIDLQHSRSICSNFEQRLKSSINVVRSAPIISKMLVYAEASPDNYCVIGFFRTLVCSPYASLQVDDSISLGTCQRSSSC